VKKGTHGHLTQSTARTWRESAHPLLRGYDRNEGENWLETRATPFLGRDLVVDEIPKRKSDDPWEFAGSGEGRMQQLVDVE